MRTHAIWWPALAVGAIMAFALAGPLVSKSGKIEQEQKPAQEKRDEAENRPIPVTNRWRSPNFDMYILKHGDKPKVDSAWGECVGFVQMPVDWLKKNVSASVDFQIVFRSRMTRALSPF